MITGLIIVAILLAGSAIWGFRNAGQGRGVSRTSNSVSPLRKAGASPPSFADSPRNCSDSSGHEKKGAALTKQVRVDNKTVERENRIATPSVWRMEYAPLVVLFLCLWILDTETWFQRALLFLLALAATFLLWFCLNGLTSMNEEERANAMKSKQKKEHEVQQKLRAL
jgi:hypothetical protein